MQTVGDMMSFACAPLTCVHQKGLFCRVASEITVMSSLGTYYLQGQTFFFSYFSSLFFDITLAPRSGSLIGTKEKDQELPRLLPPQPPNGHFQAWWWLYTHCQLTLDRAKRSCSVCGAVSVTRWRHLKGWGNSNKFMKIKLFAHFCIFKTLPSSSPSVCVLYILPSHLCHGFSGKRVYCKISRL